MARHTERDVLKPVSSTPFLDAASRAVDSTPSGEILAAKQISDAIDAELAEERAKHRLAERRSINVLLLGQTGSGKSTLLKQFRMMYSPSPFDSERLTWRPVILLNVFRTIQDMLFEASMTIESDVPEARTINRELLKQVEEWDNKFLRGCLEKLTRMQVTTGRGPKYGDRSRVFTMLAPSDVFQLNDIARKLELAHDQIASLWRDPGIQSLVLKPRLREEWRD